MHKILLLFSFLSLFWGLPVFANQKISSFENWENFLSGPLYLEAKEKKQLHPLYLEEFLEEKYLFQENLDKNQINEIVNPNFCLWEKNNSLSNVCILSQSFSQLTQKNKIRQFYIKETELKNYLTVLAEKINTQPTEGKYRLDDQGNFFPIEESVYGLTLDVEKSYEFLMEKILSGKISPNENILLSINKISPTITPESLKEMGIKEKLARGESNFSGSPANRIHNIHTAVKKFDGIILKPQEEFSFVNLLGKVDSSTGYKEELVIKDNKTIPEFGGGICQVSTTLFRTALKAGMKITERKNHAYPVAYYSPQGTDATIYIPKPDLKFINDTPAHVLIQASFEGTKLFFDFFGTADGRQTTLEGPTVTEKTDDGKMKVVLYQIIKNEKGEEIRKDTFKSFYDNPDKYHEPNFITKPDDWSNKQWDEYLKNKNH